MLQNRNKNNRVALSALVMAALTMLVLLGVGCETPVVEQGAGQQMPQGHPAIGQNTKSGGSRGGQGGNSAATLVSGEINVSESLASSVKEGDVIFIMLKDAASKSTLAAIKLVVSGKLPMSFTLSGNDMMRAGSNIMGPVNVIARLDKDGDAISKNPGDLVAELAQPLTVPHSKKTTLIFNKVL